ncbi:hypothetical protein [Halapricum salinum]|uniref:hypothetical protein n=1 Tax=Halapricum salinum TaxID=1457250 RepID=UPI0012AC0B8A|nr:hypothetical protein [Halapricum salinum]
MRGEYFEVAAGSETPDVSGTESMGWSGAAGLCCDRRSNATDPLSDTRDREA